MSEIRESFLLIKLFENSKKIGNTVNPPITVERFLVAAIDMILSYASGDCDDELYRLKNNVIRYFKDLKKAKDVLLEFISQNTKMSYIDDIYMKKKIKEAYELTMQSGEEVVTSLAVFSRIIMDPSKSIITAVNESVKAAKENNDIKEEAPVLSEAETQKMLDKAMEEFFESVEKEEEEKAEIDPITQNKNEISALVNQVKDIRKELKSVIFGQDNAINVFATGYFQAAMRSITDKNRRRPRATFLFAGPPGVGKTFLAETAARVLKLPFKRYDMSEYCNKEAAIEFCGSDAVYKNSKSGNFTSYVKDYPKCVLLFDEIEKAHISIIHLFLQILDAGMIRDSKTDEEISLKDTIMIFTTNAGRSLYKDSGMENLSCVSRKVVLNALQKDVNPETGAPFFPGAICSRFASGNVVMFNHIGAAYLRSIVKKEIEAQAQNWQRETGIKFSIANEVYTALLFSEGSNADARNMSSRSVTFLNEELYELFRLVETSKSKTGIENIEKVQITLDLDNASDEIKALFKNKSKTRVLVLSGKETVEACKAQLPDLEIIGVQNADSAVEVIKNAPVDFVMLDMYYGANNSRSIVLNVEDIRTPAREFMSFLNEQSSSLPIYLLEQSDKALSEEEKVSFYKQGIRGVLQIQKQGNAFAAMVNEVAQVIYQQSCMEKLARSNKIVSFESSQTISKSGKTAKIKLFDFKLAVAVDSEDSKNILSKVSRPNVHFDDVIGADEAKEELKYFVNYLKNPAKYMGTGVKAPKGVLLYGPPGTGKTMLAKAMACESDVTFITAEGNRFLKQFVGTGNDEVRELFATARKYAPSILFIDEIEAIAKERKGGNNAGANGEDVLTTFLTEMDGFKNDPTKPVFVLAATNFDVEAGHDRSLDPALMRRFDRRVYIDLPDKKGRIKFLNDKIAKNKAFDITDKKVEDIAMRATGMSLAELDSAMELALRSAIRNGSTKVTDEIFDEAFETFNGGEVKHWDKSQLERVARHEAGHALLCWLNGETPSYLTIVARGNHGGYMRHADDEGKEIYTRDELLGRIRTSLGGRAAEIVYYGQKDGISTGAGGDLISATKTAQYILCSCGMDDDFGLAVVNANMADGGLQLEVRAAVNKILKEQMAKSIELIEKNKDKIDALVNALMEKNHLSGEEMDEIFSK